MKVQFLIISSGLILCSAFACQDKTAQAELEKYRAQAKLREQNKVLIKLMWETWDKRDFEAWKQMHAPEYVYYSPSNSVKPLTIEETIEMGRTFFNSFPDAYNSIEELITVGDKVITRWVLRGTHKGEFVGIPATGNRVENTGIMISRILNGKVIEDREDYDSLSLMQQLGMELKPIAVKKK